MGSGALQGVKILEFAGLGPAPFCGMMLADHGAEVIRIERVGAKPKYLDPLARTRKSIALNLKDESAKALVFELVKDVDGLIEGFRPGVMEKLGLGPEVLLKQNPSLVYGRMTGWGQYGPNAAMAGHDINYIALSGVLHQCGRAGEKPTPPVNFLGDFGGGGMMLAFGMVSALLAVKNGQPGQTIDCAMTDGSALLATMSWGHKHAGFNHDERGVNRLDTGASYYDTYETKDGKYIAIGSVEPKFYALMRKLCGLENDAEFDKREDRDDWTRQKQRLTEVFLTKTRDQWDEILDGTDACYAPVLNMTEAPEHGHNLARKTFTQVDGLVQPAPAPRFSHSQEVPPRSASEPGADTVEILRGIGKSVKEIEALRERGAVG